MTETHPETPAETHAEIRDYIKSRLDTFPMLNLHLISAHASPGALLLTAREARDVHKHEHDGPGTIRNHPRGDYFWDADEVADTLIGYAIEDGDPANLRGEVDFLMTPPETKVRSASDEHTHDVPRNEAWTVCPDGNQCPTYPRFYDLSATRTADGTFTSHGSAKITNPEDDIARGLLAARSALAFMEAATDNPGLVDMARDALLQLNTSVTLLHPRLWPTYGDPDTQTTDTSTD